MKIKTYNAGARCGACDELYTNVDEAEQCCPVEELTVYMCGECEEVYEDRDEAAECCKD